MKAVLLEFSLMTRIIVPDDFNLDELNDKEYEIIRKRAVRKFIARLEDKSACENLAEISADEEMPFGEGYRDVYYQPKVSSLNSYQVFESKELAQKAFPNSEILEFYDDDIEDPEFIDDLYK